MSERLPADTRLGTAHLRVRDRRRLAAFYQDVVGLSVRSESSHDTTLGVDTDLIVLHDAPRAVPRDPRASGLYHIALLLPQRPFLARALIHLSSAYPLQGAADHFVSEALYLGDIEGNGLEIYADRPRAVWQFENGELNIGTVALDAENLLLDAGDDVWSGAPEGTTVGHVHLQVDDVDRALEFYVDVVGFDLMTTYGAQAAFVSAGGYHHHLGLNTWSSRGRKVVENALGLDHYTIVVPERDGFDATVERLRRAGAIATFEHDTAVALDPAGNKLHVIPG